MRDELLKMLCCPECREDLDVEEFNRDDDDLIEGLLICRRCARVYPVVDGVPHMLPTALAEATEFATKHRLAIGRYAEPPGRRATRHYEKLHRRTASAFGYEWNHYKVTTPEEDLLTLAFLVGFDRDLYHPLDFEDVFSHVPTAADVDRIDTTFLRGKRVLEIGCGMGKYVRTVADHGGVAVGLDLSMALDRARREHGPRKDIHWVRGNILEHPFKEKMFDFVYSVGVLHHTPDCHQAFLNSSNLVRDGGHLAVWLYPTERMMTRYARMVHFVQDTLMRPMTSRLPHSMLERISWRLGQWTFKRDEAARSGRIGLARTYALVAVGAHHDPEIAAFLNFDWYSPQYRSYHSEDELLDWYREAHYRDVRVLPQRTSAIGRRAQSDEVLSPVPEPIVRANLEAPGDEPLRRNAPFIVGGWALELTGRSPIARVHLDDRLVATTQSFAPRLDVKAAFPELDHALYTGFHVRLRVPRACGESLRLRVSFTTPDRSEPSLTIRREIKVEPDGWGRRIAGSLITITPRSIVRRLSKSALLRRLAGRPPR